MTARPEDIHRKFLEINAREAAMAHLVARKNAEAQLDIQPVVFNNTTLEDELRDINEQRNQALDQLRKVLRPEIAATFISGLVDEELIFLNETMPEFVRELQRFEPRKLNDVTVVNLFKRFTEAYNKTQGISIPMQSGELIKLDTYDPAITRDLRSSLVSEGLADDESARTFISRLKGPDLARLEREKFIEYLKEYKARLKPGTKLPSLTSIYKAYLARGPLEARTTKRAAEIEAEAGKRARDYEDWQEERLAEHAEIGEDSRGYTVAGTDIFDAERNIATRQHQIEALRQALDIERNEVRARDNEFTRRMEELNERIDELSAPPGRKTPTKALRAIKKLETQLLGTQRQAQKNVEDFERYEDGVDGNIAALTAEVQDLHDVIHNAQTFRESIVSKPRYGGDPDKIRRDRGIVSRDLMLPTREISRGEAQNVPGFSIDRDDTPQDDGDTRFGFGLRRKAPAPRRVKATAVVKRQERKAVFATFGRHRIHIPHLEYGVLDVRYPSGAKHATVPKAKISQGVQDVLLNALRDGKVDARSARRLSLEDKRMLKRLCDKSDVECPIDIEEDDQEMDRFELLKGEVLAGNDNHDIVKELRRLLMRFKSEGRVTAQQASRVLLELAQLGV